MRERGKGGREGDGEEEKGGRVGGREMERKKGRGTERERMMDLVPIQARASGWRR